jgi:hypothetical protein
MCLRRIEASVIRRGSCGLVRGGRLAGHAAPGGRPGCGGRDAPAAAPARSTAARAGRPCGAGLPVVGEIRVPGFLEGGDFFPAGRDLALVGIGLRSNSEAARQLMDGDLLGTSRLAVVRDDFEQHQARPPPRAAAPGAHAPGAPRLLAALAPSSAASLWRCACGQQQNRGFYHSGAQTGEVVFCGRAG